MIYTVGNKRVYDEKIEHARKSGGSFAKLGADGDYPGGFAVRTIEDARRLIRERGKGRGWAIYEVDADWDRDTRPSQHGWWHGLIFTSRIIGKAQ
jgi:hypothetical protein